jgi:hypothetical protein
MVVNKMIEITICFELKQNLNYRFVQRNRRNVYPNRRVIASQDHTKHFPTSSIEK